MLRKLRDKALTSALGVNQRKKKKYVHTPLPDNPKELAKALFWPNDQKIKEQKHSHL